MMCLSSGWSARKHTTGNKNVLADKSNRGMQVRQDYILWFLYFGDSKLTEWNIMISLNI